MIKKKILIATGGTGGHILPAYSLANFLVDNNYNLTVTTDKRGLKYLQDSKKFKLIKLTLSPIFKKNIYKFLISSFFIFFSIIKSVMILSLNRPSIIFGMGGYASFPVCIAASLLRIKFIIYENNLVIGKANKFLLPFAEKMFVSYKELEGVSEKYSHKILQIGNIVRENIINPNFKNNQVTSFDELRILVIGGSQAAKSFAEELPVIFAKLKNSKVPLKIFQQCQENQYEQLSLFYKEAKIDFEIFNFADNILDYYAKANLVITRAGASVLGELINCKVPFISIPLPSSADNHQYKNAVFYKNKGYGYFLEEREIKNKLYNIINSFFIDKSLIKNILVNQQQYSDKNVFKNINDYMKKILNEKN